MRIIFCAIVFAALAGCGSSSKSGSSKGFTNLLSNNAAEFHRFNGSGIPAAWTVRDGVLHFDPAKRAGGREGGDIVSNEEYEDFHLKLDWKIAPKGNSGIFFYVQEGPSYRYTFETGPEMQVVDNDGHPDAMFKTHRAGDLYDLIACSRETVLPAGQWNAAEIISEKGTLTFFLNGVQVVKTSYGDDAWRKLVAGSKFKDMPGFGRHSKGKIALQDHGDEVWFRNIQIKRLK